MSSPATPKKYYIKPPPPHQVRGTSTTSTLTRPPSSALTSRASASLSTGSSRPSSPTKLLSTQSRESMTRTATSSISSTIRSPSPDGPTLLKPPTHLKSRPRSPIRRPASIKENTAMNLSSPQLRSVSSIDVIAPRRRPSPVHTPSISSRFSTDSMSSSKITADSSNNQANVRVLVRARPFLIREIEANNKCLISMNSTAHTTTLHHPDGLEEHVDNRLENGTLLTSRHREAKEFVFDESIWSVDQDSTNDFVGQELMYDKVGKEFLDHSLEGYHTCILAYGQTGSGKSYTMIGTEDELGIIPRTCYDLFQRIERLTTATTTFTVKVSYFEIYNEHVYDLLASQTGQPTPLKIRESPVDGPYVKDLSTYIVRSFQDVESYLKKGNKQRATAATNMNATSSRSHAVFTLVLKKIESDPILDETTEETNSRIRFVDLAGSERVNSTGATGTRLREGANINKSLTTLGRVISVLSESGLATKKRDIVPYRDSTLTWLLKDSLGGNSKTAMIACVSPCDYDETLSTLRYASQAKHIRTRAVVNQDFISAIERDKMVLDMQETINKLQDTLAQNSSTHRQESDSHFQELEKFRKVIKFYEDRAEVEESKRRAIMQENETVKTHNRLIAEHIKEIRREQNNTTIPDDMYDEWDDMMQEVVTFRNDLRNDINALKSPISV
ncbi:P-loop containing nucleoside triphosphate hydrolase protein [Lipomyces japonicus]|uniref:P-loop containing nucleoside triphosphate hydrolase protein n=1 Tax=Lipomyces japonicus TaxID=56871 RepID=UPI0034CEA588